MMWKPLALHAALLCSLQAVQCYAALASPFQLLCDARTSPVLGVESRQPKLQWSQPTDATAFQLLLLTLPTGASVLDTGRVASAVSAFTVPAAAALRPSSTYTWRVRTWSSTSADPSTYSADAVFVTGLHGAFSATPIWHPNGTANFVFLRTDIALDTSSLFSATAHVTANPQPSTRGEPENAKLLGAYRLVVNGKWRGIGPGRPGTCGPVCPVGGDPGVCDCAPHHVYDTLNVTDALLASPSALTLALQCFNYPPTGGIQTATSKVLLQLTVTFNNGTQATFGSSPAWAAFNADSYFNPGCDSTTPCVSDPSWFLQPSENVDARQEQVGWSLPSASYNASTPGWTLAAGQAPFDVPLVARPTLPMAVTEHVAPAFVQVLGPGHWFIAFERELQGALRLTFTGGADIDGQTVAVRLGEEMTSWEPPTVMYKMRTGNTYLNSWTLREGLQTVEQHEYLEFRYVEVQAVEPPPQAGQCALTAPGDYTTPLTLACSEADSTVVDVLFASWGTPKGACNASGNGANTFAVDAACNFSQTSAVISSLCMGREGCTFTPSDALFGGVDPCHLVDKYLAVAVECAPLPGRAARRAQASSLELVTAEAWVLTYPASYPASFVSSSADLNAVYDFCRYTVVATALDMFTDSNTRQRSVICAEALHVNILMQFATSTEIALQRYTLEYTISHRPSALGWAEWQALTIFSVYAFYLHTGDLSLFSSTYAHLRNFTELSLINATTGLWTCDGRSFDCTKPEIDWPVGMRDGWVAEAADTVVSAYTYRAFLLFASMAADAGGHDADVTLFNAAAASLRSAMNAQLFNATGGYFVDGLGTTHAAWHSSVYALAFGVPTAEMAPAVRAYVARRSVGNQSLCQPGNVYPAQWALEALYGDGEDWGRLGAALMLCNGTAGWLAMLAQNATTTMEAWKPSDKPNLTWSHSWAASPADILPRFLLGVRPLSPGFGKILIAPQLGDLASAEGVVPTIRGPVSISVSASRQTATASVSFVVPGGATARACLPTFACTGGALMLDGVAAAGDSDDAGFVCVNGIASGAHSAKCPTTA